VASVLPHYLDDPQDQRQRPCRPMRPVVRHAHLELALEVPHDRHVEVVLRISQRSGKVQLLISVEPYGRRGLRPCSAVRSEQAAQLSTANTEGTGELGLYPGLRLGLAPFPPANRRTVDPKNMSKILLGIASSPTSPRELYTLLGHVRLSLQIAGRTTDHTEQQASH
jgi:hypothetical protein